jgi:hypothetical protein
MPDLSFLVSGVTVTPYSAAPMLTFKLCVSNADAEETIHTVVLRCQIQIEVAKRKYDPNEQEELRDLFGEPARWSQTLRNLLWTNTSVVIPSFTRTATVDLQVPCSFDFSIATTKYFNGLAGGDIPVCLMFSGTFFYADESGALQVAPISWQKETKFRVPVKTWHDMMDAYYPNSGWLCLRRDVLEELYRYKVARAIPTWERVFEEMLGLVQEEPVRRA